MTYRRIPEPDLQKIQSSLDVHHESPKHLAIAVLIETGCRTHEAVTIKSEDIDRLASTVLIKGAKGSEDRLIKLSKDLCIQLAVCVTAFGSLGNAIVTDGKISSVKVKLRKFFRQLQINIDLPTIYSLHRLRHSWVHRLADLLLAKTGTIDWRIVQKAIGHKNIANTFKYAELRSGQFGLDLMHEAISKGDFNEKKCSNH